MVEEPYRTPHIHEPSHFCEAIGATVYCEPEDCRFCGDFDGWDE